MNSDDLHRVITDAEEHFDAKIMKAQIVGENEALLCLKRNKPLHHDRPYMTTHGGIGSGSGSGFYWSHYDLKEAS